VDVAEPAGKFFVGVKNKPNAFLLSQLEFLFGGAKRIARPDLAGSDDTHPGNSLQLTGRRPVDLFCRSAITDELANGIVAEAGNEM
jgi:hypothetical protein